MATLLLSPKPDTKGVLLGQTVWCLWTCFGLRLMDDLVVIMIVNQQVIRRCAALNLGRSLCVALFVWFGSVVSGVAHGLPSSSLVFSDTEETLSLTIRLPLEDLITAAPELEGLMTKPLSDYFQEHLVVSGYDLEIRDQRIERAEDHHQGLYDLLVLELRAPKRGAVKPFKLSYYAVMHGVRNHRAAVFWKSEGETVRLIEFGFNHIDGAQFPVLISP